MSKDIMTRGALGIYRGIVLATCGAFLWLHSHFITSRQFEDYVTAHKRYGDHVILSIQRDISRIDGRLERIETKLLGNRADVGPAVGKVKHDK